MDEERRKRDVCGVEATIIPLLSSIILQRIAPDRASASLLE